MARFRRQDGAASGRHSAGAGGDSQAAGAAGAEAATWRSLEIEQKW